jgi:hypothetical protein
MMNFVGVENARAMHADGVNEICKLRGTRLTHPLGVLALVHKVLLIPESGVDENIDLAYALLDRRLKEPGALDPPIPSFIKRQTDHFLAAFTSPTQTLAEYNAKIWPLAIEIIGQPVDPFEDLASLTKS